MKIVIVNAYLRNNGDAALLSVLIEQLRRVWPAAHITIASLEYPADFPTFDECNNIGSMRLYTAATEVGKPRRMSRKLLLLLIEVLWPRLNKVRRTQLTKRLPALVRGELQAIESADLVISTGGGYLNGVNSLGGNLNVQYVLLPLKLAAKFGKAVILAPHSSGPFGNKYQERMVCKTLNEACCILVRERKSLALLTSIGVNKELLVPAVDSGFGFDTRIVSHAKPKTKAKIGLTARLWFFDGKQQAYMKALADFIVLARQRHGAESYLIPQVISDFEADDDDRIVERKIAAMVRSAGAAVEQIDERLDPHELKLFYSGLDFTVGTRFHSVIFSLTSYVPAIAIEYEHKTSGIMQDLGLQRWVIKIDDVTTEKLMAMYERLMLEREDYIRHLHEVLPAYIDQARQAGDIIKQAYERVQAAADADSQAPQKAV